MTQQIKNIEEHFHFQLNQLSIKTISSELKMKLHKKNLAFFCKPHYNFLHCVINTRTNLIIWRNEP